MIKLQSPGENERQRYLVLLVERPSLLYYYVAGGAVFNLLGRMVHLLSPMTWLGQGTGLS